MKRSIRKTIIWITVPLMLLVTFAMTMIGMVPVKAFSTGDNVTFTGTYVTSSVSPYDHMLSGRDIYLIVGSKYDSLLNQSVNLNVTYTTATHFVVDSITATSTPAPTPTFTPYSKSFTGTLESMSSSVYNYTLQGMNIWFVFHTNYSSWVGSSVTVNVTYTSASHFVVNSVVKN